MDTIKALKRMIEIEGTADEVLNEFLGERDLRKARADEKGFEVALREARERKEAD